MENLHKKRKVKRKRKVKKKRKIASLELKTGKFEFKMYFDILAKIGGLSSTAILQNNFI